MSEAIAHWDDVPKRRRDNGFLGATWRDLGSAAGSLGIGVTRIEMAAGEIPTPPHMHQNEEEIFFVLGGSGLSWQDGRTYEIGAGDVLVHPVFGAPHTLRAGPEGLDVLAFGQRALGQGGYLPRAGIIWAWPGWVEVGAGDAPWDREAALGPPEFPEPEAERPETIRNLADVEPLDFWPRERGVRRRLAPAPLTEFTGLGHWELEPGQMSAPAHCHSAEEEICIVLEGSGVLSLGDEEHAVRRGHVVARPPGSRVAHALRAADDEGLTYVVYGTRVPDDVAFYPRSNKLFFRGVGVIARIEPLDYWDGEL